MIRGLNEERNLRISFILLINLFAIATHAFSVTELETQRLKIGAPGAGAGLITYQAIDVWTTGVCKAGSRVKIQDTDKFHLGSNTKAMTATLLAQWIECGFGKHAVTDTLICGTGINYHKK